MWVFCLSKNWMRTFVMESLVGDQIAVPYVALSTEIT